MSGVKMKQNLIKRIREVIFKDKVPKFFLVTKYLNVFEIIFLIILSSIVYRILLNSF